MQVFKKNLSKFVGIFKKWSNFVKFRKIGQISTPILTILGGPGGWETVGEFGRFLGVILGQNLTFFDDFDTIFDFWS